MNRPPNYRPFTDNKRVSQKFSCHEFNNLDEMDKFLERHKLPKMHFKKTKKNQKTKPCIYIPISIKEIKFVV